MPALYNPDHFRQILKRQLTMCYGADNCDAYYHVVMILIRIVQDQYYERYQVVWTEYQAFRHICSQPNVFLILDGRY